jgi:hypothetical protein
MIKIRCTLLQFYMLLCVGLKLILAPYGQKPEEDAGEIDVNMNILA